MSYKTRLFCCLTVRYDPSQMPEQNNNISCVHVDNKGWQHVVQNDGEHHAARIIRHDEEGVVVDDVYYVKLSHLVVYQTHLFHKLFCHLIKNHTLICVQQHKPGLMTAVGIA